MRKRILFAVVAVLMFQNSFAQTVFNIPLIKNQNLPMLVPGGEAIGIKLYTKGLLVIETASFEDKNGNVVSPALDAGVRQSDIVLSVNGVPLHSNSQLRQAAQKGKVSLKILRASSEHTLEITPAIAKDGTKKIGLWVRDSAAGIGTLTFKKADNNKFAALGHGIIDCDLKSMYLIDEGSIQEADIVSVVKGEKGVPGELKGIFSKSGSLFGTITENSDEGIYGTLSISENAEKIPAASKWEVTEGAAQIICTVDEEKQKYDVVIESISPLSMLSSKSMIVRVTDNRLLEKTGGIVQGMSGSPIIQNGKLVGAITHVFVNDPTRGYGIFIENMLAEAEKIK